MYILARVRWQIAGMEANKICCRDAQADVAEAGPTSTKTSATGIVRSQMPAQQAKELAHLLPDAAHAHGNARSTKYLGAPGVYQLQAGRCILHHCTLHLFLRAMHNLCTHAWVCMRWDT
jgi:hypothetical protein